MYMEVYFLAMASVPLLKILNVSKLPRMAVVLVSNVFAVQTRRYKMYTDVHFVPCLRLICVRAYFKSAGGKATSKNQSQFFCNFYLLCLMPVFFIISTSNSIKTEISAVKPPGATFK